MLKIISLLTLTLFVSSVNADNHHHHGADWVAPLIGGIVIGGIAAQTARPTPVYPQPYPQTYYVPTCREINTIHYDQFGRQYYYPQTVCN